MPDQQMPGCSRCAAGIAHTRHVVGEADQQEPVCEHLWAVAVLGPYAFHEGERIRSVEFFWDCQKCRTVEESQWDR